MRSSELAGRQSSSAFESAEIFFFFLQRISNAQKIFQIKYIYLHMCIYIYIIERKSFSILKRDQNSWPSVRARLRSVYRVTFFFHK